jgi:hypothetical protein
VNAQQLVDRLTRLRENDDTAEVLRAALLLALHAPDLNDLEDDEQVERQLRDVEWQMRAALDQHAAVADELDSLASTAPCDFSSDHLWTLVRAIKVQHQILNLYLGPSWTES